MKEIIFQGTDMVKTFGETIVLQGISLKLYQGDFAVIMGSSGSGKSTFLYAVSGMDRLSGGQLFYKGKQSCDEMIDIAHASEKEIWEKTDVLIRQMCLEKAKDRLPAQVSGGEAQRAAVARAVIAGPRILFADEPTGALNKANTEEVLDLLTALYAQGQSILLVTHDREAALRGNRILYLEDGSIVGELELSPYQGKDREREQKLASWLEGFRW